MKKEKYIIIGIISIILIISFQVYLPDCIVHGIKMSNNNSFNNIVEYDPEESINISCKSTTYAKASWKTHQGYSDEELEGFDIDINQPISQSLNHISVIKYQHTDAYVDDECYEASSDSDIMQSFSLDATNTFIHTSISTQHWFTLQARAVSCTSSAAAEGKNNYVQDDEKFVEPLEIIVPFTVVDQGFIFVQKSFIVVDDASYYIYQTGKTGKGYTIVDASWSIVNEQGETILSDFYFVNNKYALCDQWEDENRCFPISPGEYSLIVTYKSMGTADIGVLRNYCLARNYLCIDEYELTLYFTPFHIGDINNDGTINFEDIQALITALQGEDYFYEKYPNGNYWAADINLDGQVTFDDVGEFIKLLN